jgi:hypothetical protein
MGGGALQGASGAEKISALTCSIFVFAGNYFQQNLQQALL